MSWRLSAVAVALALVGLLAGACDSSFVGSSSPSNVSCEVSASMPGPFESGGGSGTFTVKALPECSWRITPAANWITVKPVSGQGEQRVTIELQANTRTEERQAEIVINDQRLVVRQEAAPPPPPPPPPPPAPPPPGPAPPPAPPPGPTCAITLASPTASIGAGGGTVAIGVTTGATCSWNAASHAPWITRTSAATGLGPFVLTLTVAPNPGAARAGTVSVGTAVLTVNQAGTQAAPCSYDVEPNRFRNVDGDGQAGLQITVQTAAGCAWTAVSQVPWITITAGASGTGPGTVTFSVAANPGNNRTGNVLVAGRTVRVDQRED